MPQQPSIVVDPAHIAADTEMVAKILKCSLAAIAVLAIFIIFVHPATMLLPATFSKHLPLVHLLVLAVAGSLVPLLTVVAWWTHGVECTPPACNRSERLAIICTRLC